MPSSSSPSPTTLLMEEIAKVNATEFFKLYNADVMTHRTCTERVLEFQPTCKQFLNILGQPGVVLYVGAGLGFAILLILFIDTVIKAHKVLPASHKFTVSVILSVYPVLGLCSFLGILFPKANALMDAANQLWFSLCMLQFFKLTLMYFGGETAFVEHMEGKVLPWRGLPCCFWPCCWPLCPKTPVNKNQVKLIRMLVMQHPFVQSIMTIIALTLWVEGYYNMGEYNPLKDAYIYILVITTTSFLFALWAFIVGFKASIPELRCFNYGLKTLAFQLCLVFLRLQAIIFNLILLPSGAIPCMPPISPAVFANTILCSLLLGQLVILSVLARHVYSLPVPLKITNDEKSMAKLLEQQQPGPPISSLYDNLNVRAPPGGDFGRAPSYDDLSVSPPYDDLSVSPPYDDFNGEASANNNSASDKHSHRQVQV